MPVKYIDEKTGQFIEGKALQESGAPRAYGIKTADDLVASSLSTDKKTYHLYRAKL